MECPSAYYSLISEGHTAHIYIVEDQTGKKIAKKQFKPQISETQIRNEISILQSLHHPHCNKLLHATQSSIYLEYLQNGDLFSLVSSHRLDEETSKKYLRQLVSVLMYLHYEKNIAHRDIKLENILLDDDKNVVLCDFGFSKRY